jgi:hypothetical protein
MSSPFLTRLEELQKRAGSRGYTFAGRYVQSTEESLESILSRLPIAELETAGFQQTARVLNTKSPLAQILRNYVKPLREIGKLPQDEESRAEVRANIAEDIAPLTNFLRMLRESPLAGIIHVIDRSK